MTKDSNKYVTILDAVSIHSTAIKDSSKVKVIRIYDQLLMYCN